MTDLATYLATELIASLHELSYADICFTEDSCRHVADFFGNPACGSLSILASFDEVAPVELCWYCYPDQLCK